MPISVECKECGKKLKVPDEWVGKKAKCPGCGATFIVGEGGAALTAQIYPTAIKPPKVSEPKFTIDANLIIIAVITLLVLGVVFAGYFGPVRMKHQWDAISQQAENDVTDVVSRSVESYVSQAGVDLRKAHQLPGVRDVSFHWPMLVMSMPKTVKFHGTTTEGEFDGDYYPATGEVDATVETGGLTVAGLETAVHKGNGSMHVTGRKKNGDLQVEINGKNAVVVYPSLDDK